MALAGLLLISYLIGAFPTAVIVGKILRGIDIRQHGSKSAGGTNAWRVLGWKGGVPVAAIDLGKGVIAATVICDLPFGPLPIDPAIVPILCGLSAVIGHVFPVYIGFRGGKGVATGAGMLLATAPIPVAIAVPVFALSLILTGRVSIGSLLGAITVPLVIVLLNRYTAAHYPSLLIGLTAALAAFILFTHRGNIVRLFQGKERSFPRVQILRRVFHR